MTLDEVWLGGERQMLRLMSKSFSWSSKITLVTFILALFFSALSSIFGDGSGLMLSLIVVFIFILIGIIADTVGLAAATSKEQHFHSMAAKKITGAKEAAFISKNAPLFSSFFNDVMGDIAGIVSGAASTAVVMQLAFIFSAHDRPFLFLLLSIVITSIIAALTVGGKAICKTVAIYKSTTIIFFLGKVLYYINKLKKIIPFRK